MSVSQSLSHYTTSDILYLLIMCLAIAGFVAYQAHLRGKNPKLWFLLGLVFGLLAPIFLLYFTSTPTSPTVSFNKDERSEEGLSSKKAMMPDSLFQENLAIFPHSEEIAKQIEEDKLWYYLDQHRQQIGPVSFIALHELWNRGQLELTSLVWTKGMQQWQKIDDLPDLKKML